MYDKCESCGKFVKGIDDVKLFSNNSIDIKTYCKECYERKKQTKI